MVCSQSNSSQVASADVLGRRILLFSMHESVTLLPWVLHRQPCCFYSCSSSRSGPSTPATGRKITSSTTIPNRRMAITEISFCHTSLPSTRIKRKETPRIWQTCRRDRHSAKSMERIITKAKISAFCMSSGRPTQAHVRWTKKEDMGLIRFSFWN
jgi:hypothetical protein